MAHEKALKALEEARKNADADKIKARPAEPVKPGLAGVEQPG